MHDLLVYVAIIQHLNYTRQESKRAPQFAVCFCNTSDHEKHEKNQGHEIQYNSLDSSQGYNHAHFERPHLKQCLWKSQCVRSGNTSIISWTQGKSKKEWYIHDPFYIINSPAKFWLNQIRTHMFLLKLFDTAWILLWSLKVVLTAEGSLSSTNI